MLSTIACILSISVFAQVEQDITRPSINAGQFSIGAKVETALSTGQLSLNIPLMELKGRGYDLPVSLAFYNGDVTFCTEASPIGLGWSLIAGGVITKTIKGADDTDNSNNHIHFTDSNYIANRYSDWRNYSTFADEILVDPMPDEYTYSLPGHSGTIDVSSNNGTISMKLYPDESYIIEKIAHGYRITADDGTKFYFEDVEVRRLGAGSDNKSTSWFLSRIETVKGGTFYFYYADEEYVDLTSGGYDHDFAKYLTKRISSIVSDFGSITFNATIRADRSGWGNQPITRELSSCRINKIELKDENGDFVKGVELDNSGMVGYHFASEYDPWYNFRHKLSSVTQYDGAGNRLPPYEFVYDYDFYSPRLTDASHSISYTGYDPCNSWTSNVGNQVYVNLKSNGAPSCIMIYPNSPYSYFEGISFISEESSATQDDYFCISSITYPTGARDIFTYEPHDYKMVNNTDASSQADRICGKRLASKTRIGTNLVQKTEYVYKKHDSNYNATSFSSGVMTNPSIHGATYYTPEREQSGWKFSASRVTSDNAFNSFMGPPVYYTEVEEVEKDANHIVCRTIHYFEHRIVAPPVNYIFVNSSTNTTHTLVRIENQILGKKSGYLSEMSFMNNGNYTYLTYPVGEFTNVNYTGGQPLKEIFIGKDGRVRSKKEYNYSFHNNYIKYGYKAIKNDFRDSYGNLDFTASWICRSEYYTGRYRLSDINTTLYYYNEENRDSICEYYGVSYNKGREYITMQKRGSESKFIKSYFPDDITNISHQSNIPEIQSINKLIEKNIIAAPIKTIIKRNGTIAGGECKDYQIRADIPLLKSIYKIENTNNNQDIAPTINGSNIDYYADKYKEGEIVTHDDYHNPQQVRISNSLNRLYVWGYEGRYPIAIIENMDSITFSSLTTLKAAVLSLDNYRKIETVRTSNSLRDLNNSIRRQLPDSVHITTFTYDPYFGITSEMDDSNCGIIYTYDSFGRLSAKYDTNYKKTEEYDYKYYLQ